MASISVGNLLNNKKNLILNKEEYELCSDLDVKVESTTFNIKKIVLEVVEYEVERIRLQKENLKKTHTEYSGPITYTKNRRTGEVLEVDTSQRTSHIVSDGITHSYKIIVKVKQAKPNKSHTEVILEDSSSPTLKVAEGAILNMKKGDSVKVHSLKLVAKDGSSINHVHAFSLGEGNTFQVGLNSNNFNIADGICDVSDKLVGSTSFSNITKVWKRAKRKKSFITFGIIFVLASYIAWPWLSDFLLYFILFYFIFWFTFRDKSNKNRAVKDIELVKALRGKLWTAINGNLTEDYTKTGWNLLKEKS
jgi:hypothetical protein